MVFLSKSMASKQKGLNLCEKDKEYPTLRQSSSPPRHLSTNSQPVKNTLSLSIPNFAPKIIVDQQGKDSKKHLKDNIDIIQLFQDKQEDKLYRKCRTRLQNKTHQQRDISN